MHIQIFTIAAFLFFVSMQDICISLLWLFNFPSAKSGKKITNHGIGKAFGLPSFDYFPLFVCFAYAFLWNTATKRKNVSLFICRPLFTHQVWWCNNSSSLAISAVIIRQQTVVFQFSRNTQTTCVFVCVSELLCLFRFIFDWSSYRIVQSEIITSTFLRTLQLLQV